MRTLRHRVLLGLRVGIVAAIVLSMVAAIIFFAAGPRPEDFRVTLLQSVVLYLTAGLLIGGVAGALAPVARRWPGAIVLGIICALPLAIAVQMMLYGSLDWTAVDLVGAAIWSLIMGSAVGIAVWFNVKRYF